jgi:lipoprotein-anchoring transpeptidase ErfK/SrfK
MMRTSKRTALPRRSLALVVCALGLLWSPAATQARTHPAVQQEIVLLLGNHGVRAKPSSKAKKLTTVLASRPITGARTGMPVIANKIDKRGRRWMRVRLPGRVIGKPTPPRTGWISASATNHYSSPWHVVVSRSARHAYVYRDGKQVKDFQVIVGKPSTPTPSGKFFVEENIRMPSSAAGAPFALALSARSKVLQEFEGGPGQIALHGLENVGGDMGTAQSHGCVRVGNTDVTWLAKHIGQGVPVTIE